MSDKARARRCYSHCPMTSDEAHAHVCNLGIYLDKYPLRLDEAGAGYEVTLPVEALLDLYHPAQAQGLSMAGKLST